MRRVTDADGVEWTLVQEGAVGVGTSAWPDVTHAIVLATAGERTVKISPPVGWESVPDAKLIAMLSKALTNDA